MKKIIFSTICVCSIANASTSSSPGMVGGKSYTDKEYFGFCDASAVVSTGSRHFIVGDDEKNQLSIYQVGQSRPVSVLKLEGPKKKKEFDIEAGTAFGSYQLWMGSHSRTKDGEESPSRHVFFATTFENGRLVQTGSVYTKLVADLSSSSILSEFEIGEAAKFPAEHPDGLNIEGIASDGETLWIAMRGPLREGRALIVAVANPMDVVLHGEKAHITAAYTLDLNRRGIRDLNYDKRTGQVLLIAGSVSDRKQFSIFRWQPGFDPVEIAAISGDFNPEGLIISHGAEFTNDNGSLAGISLISDDGSYERDDVVCRKRELSKQSFRVRSWPGIQGSH